MNKRVFSGVKPSGNLHLGNYIGALSQWVKNQEQYANVFCIVDLHAITIPIDAKKLYEQTRSVAAWYLSAGIDPEKSIIFIQSHNPDHAQLSWILNCFTGVGQLSRMTQYKDKKQKTEFVSAGLFDYPVLMAADILLYDTHLVPVGEDQKQHVELTRDLALRLNEKYSSLFTLPEYMPPLAGARVMSLQNPKSKMSKSESDPIGTIDLTDKPEIIRKKVLSAVTDSGNKIGLDPQRPAIFNLTTIFMALSGKTEQALDQEYSGKGYKKFKEDLAEVIIQTLSPMQAKYKAILENGALEGILKEGAEKAQKISGPKLTAVKRIIGLG